MLGKIGQATMAMIAGAIVIIGTGATVTYVASSSSQGVSETVDEGKISDTDQLKQSCLIEQSTVCNADTIARKIATGQEPAGGWAKHVTVNQQTCWQHAKERDIFGPQGTDSIPQCSFAGDNEDLAQCRDSVIPHCTDSDDARWKGEDVENIPETCYQQDMQETLPTCSEYREIIAERQEDSEDSEDDGEDGGDEEQGSFYLEIQDVSMPREIEDQDIIIPKITVDTNANSLGIQIGSQRAGLYDTGNHNDGEKNDGTYANIIDISSLSGENINAQLVYNYQGPRGTRDLGEITIDNQFSSPTLQADLRAFNDQDEQKAARIDISTGTEALVTVETRLWKQGHSDNKHIETFRCTSTCTPIFTWNNIFNDLSLNEGDTVYAAVEMTETDAFPNQEGLTATAEATYNDNPVIVDTYLHSRDGETVADGTSWKGDLLGIAVSGASIAQIDDITLTDHRGNKLADAHQVGGVTEDWISFQVQYSDYTTASYTATIGPDRLADLGETTDINVKASFSDGTTFTQSLRRVETVEDTQPPEITDIRLGYLEEDAEMIDPLPPGEPTAAITLTDDLSRNIDGDISIQKGEDEEEKSWDGKVPPADLNTTIISLDDIEMDLQGPVSLTVEAEDESGNKEETTATKTLETTADGTLREIEKNGDPADKINIIMLGDQFQYDTFKDKANTYIDYFYTAGDFSDVHAPHRDLFNWYIVDTRETDQLCQDYSKEGQPFICPNGLEFIDDVVQNSETFQGAATGTLIVTKENVRPYAKEQDDLAHAVVSTTFEQEASPPPKNTVAHELGHLIWGFADEYSIDGPDTRLGESRETVFFNWNRGDFTPRENGPGEYTNVWTGSRLGENVQLKCEAAISDHYASIADASWCREITSLNNKGYTLHDDSVGRSLMWENQPNYYPTHKKRIEYLIEHGVYE